MLSCSAIRMGTCYKAVVETENPHGVWSERARVELDKDYGLSGGPPWRDVAELPREDVACYYGGRFPRFPDPPLCWAPAEALAARLERELSGEEGRTEGRLALLPLLDGLRGSNTRVLLFGV